MSHNDNTQQGSMWSIMDPLLIKELDKAVEWSRPAASAHGPGAPALTSDATATVDEDDHRPTCGICSTTFPNREALRKHAARSRRHRFNARLRARLGSAEKARKFALSRGDFAAWMRSCEEGEEENDDDDSKNASKKTAHDYDDDDDVSFSGSSSGDDSAVAGAAAVAPHLSVKKGDDDAAASSGSDDDASWRVTSSEAWERYVQQSLETVEDTDEGEWAAQSLELRWQKAPKLILTAKMSDNPEDDCTLTAWRCMLRAPRDAPVEDCVAELRRLTEQAAKAQALSHRLQTKAKQLAKNKPAAADASLPAEINLPFLWSIFLIGGGYFAGAVFCGTTAIRHKVLRRYTVRKKQGGSQETRDNSGGGRPKSIGAQIRRQMTLKLAKEVLEILHSWEPLLQRSHRVFFAAPGGTYRQMLFATRQSGSIAAREVGDSPLLKPDGSMVDSVSSVPFTTFKPSLAELTRCMSELATIEISRVGSSPSTIEGSAPAKKVVPKLAEKLIADASAKETKGKSHLKARPTEGGAADGRAPFSVESEVKDAAEESCREKIVRLISEGKDFSVIEQAVSDLRAEDGEAGTSVTPLFAACSSDRGDVLELVSLMLSSPTLASDVNVPCGQAGHTPLHAASQTGRARVLTSLLEAGANPTIVATQKPKVVPYDLLSGKNAADARVSFRTFAGQNLDKWNWSDAHVDPLSVDQASQQAQGKAAKRKRKNAVTKVKQQEQKRLDAIEAAIREVVEARKSREASLPDRERRGLAADRRVLKSTPPDFGASSLACVVCGAEVPLVSFVLNGQQACSEACVRKRVLETMPE